MKKTIKTLVIEDDPFFVAVLENYTRNFKEFGLIINHRTSLEDSLIFLDENPDTQLIIMDYRVHSEVTGLDILQHIRAKGINIPVIVVTASGDEETAVALFKAGASDYLPKRRISPSVLEESIKEALSHYEIFYNNQKTNLLKEDAIKKSLSSICILDSKGTITYCNLSFLKDWRYENEKEVVGKHLRNFLYNPKDFDNILTTLKGQKNVIKELLGKRKDGTQFYIQSLFSLVEQYKKEEYIICSFIDTTKIKLEQQEKEHLYKAIMEVFALKAEEVGNAETSQHIHRIAAYVKFLTTKLKDLEPFKEYIDEKYIEDLSYASMLHDVGKWRTPNEILLKPSSLSAAEWEIIKQHPRLGVEMLSPVLKQKGSSQYLRLVESIVLYHHERWDGSGYPEGLKGEEIPLSARIVAICDVYDALTSDRSYRKALTHEEAIEIIKKEADAFDPRILKVFLDNHLEIKKIKESIKE